VDDCNFFADADDSFVTEIFQKSLFPESSYTAATSVAPIATLRPLPDLARFQQPDSRRNYTRGDCPAGWAPGNVDTGQVPTGLPGCVPNS
jgi:ribose transport system substrate-binding protein